MILWISVYKKAYPPTYPPQCVVCGKSRCRSVLSSIIEINTSLYPRPKLAAKYLHVFDIGLTCARALFAKRRMGKSEFLEMP